MKKNIVNNSFVFYATNLEVIEELEETNPELAADFMKSIIEYGIYGEYNSSNHMVKILMIQAGFGIDKAKDRYAAAVENGKKGGRPQVQLDEAEVNQKKVELKTWKAVAKYYGITEQGLKNKRNKWKNEKNPKNLNDNVNDNVNDNDNEKQERILPTEEFYGGKAAVSQQEKSKIIEFIGDRYDLVLFTRKNYPSIDESYEKIVRSRLFSPTENQLIDIIHQCYAAAGFNLNWHIPA